jgi:hypothetical protein
VREVRRAALDRPVLHRIGDRVGDAGSAAAPWLDRLLKRLEHRLGQPRPLHFFVEHVDAKQVFDVRGLEIDAIEL